MTVVTQANLNNQAHTFAAAQGKTSGWFGTSCGLCLLGALMILYLPVMLPFFIASYVVRAVRGH